MNDYTCSLGHHNCALPHERGEIEILAAPFIHMSEVRESARRGCAEIEATLIRWSGTEATEDPGIVRHRFEIERLP